MKTIEYLIIEKIAHEVSDYVAHHGNSWSIYDGPSQTSRVWSLSECDGVIELQYYGDEPEVQWSLTLEAAMPASVTADVIHAAINAQEAIR